MGLSLADFINLIGNASPGLLLAAAVYGLVVKRWVVPYHFYAELRADRDQWRETALRLMALSERGTNVAEAVIRHKGRTDHVKDDV